MKINKLNIKLFTLALGLIAFTSCEEDDITGLDALAKPMATTNTTDITIAEGESDVISYTIAQPINKASQFKIELVGGNGAQEDITAGDGDTDADTGIPHVGFEITVPAYADSFDIPVSAIRDLDPNEGTETIRLRISAAGVRTILTQDGGDFVNVTIEDYVFCFWNLVAVDTYGDGWNGASIRLTADGEVSDYFNDDPDGEIGSETVIIDIPVADGAAYSFEFVSGDWDGEIEYTLTAPDGTEFTSTGGYPAVGEITSGTNTCN